MFSSSDYKTAAAVMAAEGYFSEGYLLSELRERADKASRLEDYLVELQAELDPRYSSVSNGYRVLFRLVDDGWTAPEGLL